MTRRRRWNSKPKGACYPNIDEPPFVVIEVEMRVQIEFLDERKTAITNDEFLYDGTVPVPKVGEVLSLGRNMYTVTNRIFHYLTLAQRVNGRELPDVKVTLILESRHQLTAQGHRA